MYYQPAASSYHEHQRTSKVVSPVRARPMRPPPMQNLIGRPHVPPPPVPPLPPPPREGGNYSYDYIASSFQSGPAIPPPLAPPVSPPSPAHPVCAVPCPPVPTSPVFPPPPPPGMEPPRPVSPTSPTAREEDLEVSLLEEQAKSRYLQELVEIHKSRSERSGRELEAARLLQEERDRAEAATIQQQQHHGYFDVYGIFHPYESEPGGMHVHYHYGSDHGALQYHEPPPQLPPPTPPVRVHHSPPPAAVERASFKHPAPSTSTAKRKDEMGYDWEKGLLALFELFDRRKEGRVNQKELREQLQPHGINLNWIPGEDSVDLTGFRKLFLNRQNGVTWDEIKRLLWVIWSSLDRDASGALDTQERVRFMRVLGLRTIQWTDRDGDNEMDFEEFWKMVRDGATDLSTKELRAAAGVLASA